MADLEAEIVNLQASLGASNAELAAMQSQLASVKKEKMKLENEKMMGERLAKKDLEELRARFEDANYELEDWRRSTEGGAKEEMEKVRNEGKIEMKNLKEKLEKDVQEKSTLIQNLEAKVSRLGDLEIALEKERKIKSELERAMPLSIQTPASSDESAALTEKIATFEAELTAARFEGETTQAGVADRTIRKLQRELESARRDNQALGEQVDDLHERNHSLTTRIPLPESQMSSPKLISSVESAQLAAVEAQVVTLEAELEQRQRMTQEEVRNLESQLDEANTLLEVTKMDVQSVKLTHDLYRHEMKVSNVISPTHHE